MNRLLIAALVLSTIGCTDPRTEVVVVISTKGVRVPDDVDSVALTVTDLDAPEQDKTRFNETVLLAAGAPEPGTFTLPLTATLIPGSMRPNDRVRVQVDAVRNGTPVISDAAIFPFAKHTSQRLDFVLYANCLGNVTCAMRDLACGPDASCVPVMPQPFGGEPDLAAGPADLSPPPPDLFTPPDLTGIDLKGCVPNCSTQNRHCGSDGCGGSCAPGCSLPATCDEPSGQCMAPPDMAGCVVACGSKVCGPDNCGHSNGCGMCNSPNTCDPSGQCVAPPPRDMSMPPDMDMSMPPDMDMMRTDGLMAASCTMTGDFCCLGTPNYCKNGLVCYSAMNTCGPLLPDMGAGGT